MNVTEALPLLSDYSHAVVIYKDAEGYPFSVATDFTVEDGHISLRAPRTGPELPADLANCQLVFSHIRPQEGVGYDERRYVELTGALTPGSDGWDFVPVGARGWNEQSLPFFELCERALPQARRYLASLSQERGETIKPRMSRPWTFFLATRVPFLTATLVPVILGIAAAVYEHHFSWGLAVITLIGAICIQLGLNVANDYFDARSGADEYNVTPTMFSGGSRVIQYGLVDVRQMALLFGVLYGIAIVCGLILTALSGIGLLWLGIAGVLISFFYTAPPLKLVHRGLGELAVAVGFGPIMVLGAYFVQTGHYAWRPLVLSIPVAILVMLILYANEIPDRISDARAGKRTLVVRLSAPAVINGYILSAAVAYLSLVAGVIVGLVPWPALIALVTLPLAIKAAQGLRAHYNSPYEVMPFLQTNIMLHLAFGVLLIAGVFAGHLAL